MSVYDLSDIFSIYDVLNTEKDDVTGSISAQLGDATCSEVYSENAEVWSHFGFCSRPSIVQPDADNAPQAISITRSDQDLIIAERDTRGQQIYGELSPGETCLYSSGTNGDGQVRILLKADGGISLFTREKNQEANPGMGIFINAMDDSISILNSKGLGIRIDNEHGILLKGADGQNIALGFNGLTQLGDVQIGNLTVGGSASVLQSLGVAGPTQLSALTAGATTTGQLTAAHISGSTVIAGTAPTVVPGPVVLV